MPLSIVLLYNVYMLLIAYLRHAWCQPLGHWWHQRSVYRHWHL